MRRIPRGRVASYREIARAIGHPEAQRAVGSALRANRDHSVPCHRVVRSDGSAGSYGGGAGGGTENKIRLLREEGMFIDDRGRIVR